MTPGEEETSFD